VRYFCWEEKGKEKIAKCPLLELMCCFNPVLLPMMGVLLCFLWENGEGTGKKVRDDPWGE
jgi:hypothetical protein